MVEQHKHEFQTGTSSLKKPYHFVNSGLPNVYLVGVKNKVCRICHSQSAEIPGIEELMSVIARAVRKKEAPLSGPEIRFLRKRLGEKSSDFGQIIGVTEEQVSRWENGHNLPEKSADKLIRVFYCHLSGDPELKEQVDRHIEGWLATIPGEENISKYCARLQNQEWTAEPVTSCQR